MKSVAFKIVIALGFFFFMSQVAEAQSAISNSKSKTSTSYSYSSSKSSSSGKSSRTSVSSSENNESITMNARFNKRMTDRVKALIVETLGANNETKGRRMIWDEVIDGLELSLSKGRLRLFYEKNKDQDDEITIQDLIEEISESIQG